MLVQEEHQNASTLGICNIEMCIASRSNRQFLCISLLVHQLMNVCEYYKTETTGSTCRYM